MNLRLMGVSTVAGIAAGWVSVATAQVKWEALCEPGSGGAIVSISVSPHDSRRMLVAGDMLGVGLSTDAGNSWKWATGFKGWEMCDSTWSPEKANVVWMGSMVGPYLSTDGGATFSEKRKGMPSISGGAYTAPVEKVLFDPDQPHRLLAFGGTSRRWQTTNESRTGVIWESTDDGENWHRLTTITESGSDPARDKGLNIVAASYLGTSGSRLMLLADGGGVFVSEDDGKNWTKANTGLTAKGFDVGRLAVHPTDENVAYIGIIWTRDEDGKHAPGAIYKTTDGGRSWVKKAKGLGQVITDPKNQNLISNYSAIAIARSNPSILYTCDGSWAQGIIYKSIDGGETWMPNCTRGNRGQRDNEHMGKIAMIETATFAGLSMGFMTVAPADPNTVLAVNSEYIARTLDGGKTWDDATAYRPDASKPDHWRGRGYSGWCSTNVAFNPKDPDDAILTMMDAGKGWRSRDGMKSWKYLGLEPWAWGGATQAVYSGDVIYLTAGQFNDNLGIHKFTSDGKQIVLAGDKHGLPELHQGGQPNSVYALPDDPSKVWATIGGKLYGSSNGGEKWRLIEGRRGLEWIAGDPTKPTRFYISGSAGVYVCEDGQTLKNIGGPKPGSRGRAKVDAKGRLYVCLWRQPFGGLWRYDSGNWTRLLDDAYINDVAADPSDPTRIIAVTSDDPYHDYTNASGAWISGDDGKSWSQQNTGLEMLRFGCVAFNPHNPEQIVAGAYGSGFFKGIWAKSYRPAGTKSYRSTEEDGDFAAADEAGPATRDAAGLLNGNMTAVGGAGPDGFTDIWGEIKIKRDKRVFHSGPAALRAEGFAGKQGQVTQTLDWKAGQRFKVSGWLKVDGDAKVNFMVQPRNEGWNPIGFEQVGYAQDNWDWRHCEKEVTMPEGTARASIGMLIEGKGHAWLDDVKVEPLGTAAAAVASSTSTPAQAPAQPQAAAKMNILRDFASAGLDYTYDGTSWKNGQNVTSGKEGGVGFLQIDATEHGGGGIALNGRNIVPDGQDKLAIRARLMPGHGGGGIVVNLIGSGKSVTFPASALSADAFKTIAVALPAGDYSKVEQLQIQGANFSPAAGAFKVQIAMVGTYGSGGAPAAKPADAAVSAPAQKPAATTGAEPAISTTIRDFGPAGVDYLYNNTGWKNADAIKTGADAGVGYLQIDSTEHGGAGLVLNGISLAPHGEKFLAVRARLLPGNRAGTLHINVNRDGASQLGYDIPLDKLGTDKFATVTVPLGSEDVSRVAQMQIQGTNFSAGAAPLKIQIDKIGTTTGEATLSEAVKKELASDTRSGPPAKDKPSVPGWGFWPQFPQAWMQMHEGFVNRARQGNIDVAFFGDSITQGWGNDANSQFVKYFGKEHAANFGIGGDTTRQVLWRMLNGELDGYKAKLFVIKIGTNNLYNDHNSGSDEEIAEGIRQVVATVRQKQPQAKVLLLGILPRQNDYFCGRIERINAIIRKLDDGKTVRYLDMRDQFLGSPGKVKADLYSGDQLHLAPKGYDVWAATMMPLFGQMLK